MSCPYYKFKQNDYFCLKKDGYINNDVYKHYCKDYNYSDCPIYKEEDNNGCYITSACVGVLGYSFSDDVLMILRNFRDSYMCQNGILLDEVKEYYNIAPKIVEKINAQNNFYEIYQELYNKMIVPCVEAIKCSRFDEAYDIYKTECQRLKENFL